MILRSEVMGQRGFTLVELMMSVAIVGLLSSIAIPNFGRIALRARTAERATVMVAIAKALQGPIQANQQIPNVDGASPSSWTGPWNPPGIPGASKRLMSWGMAGWTSLSMFVEGDCYYSYSFVIVDNGGTTTCSVVSQGDLDANGIPSTVTHTYPVVGYAFQSAVETIAGDEF